ncbi:autotransporter family protein [Bradyrhizobium sp. USDA 10063]
MSGGLILLDGREARAGCDFHDPISGQTVTCSTAAPNPDPTRVEAVAGSTNVTVNVLPGSGITTANNAILVRDQSQVINQGTIIQTGNTTDGIRVDSNNTVTNTGSITTSGSQSEGMFSQGGQNNMLVNEVGGTITTTGASADGMSVFTGVNGNTLINRGTITTSGDGSNGMEAFDGNNNSLANAGTITTAGANASAVTATGNGNTFVNSGSINTSGLNAHGVTWNGATPGAITNTGAITAAGPGGLGLFLGGPTTLTNSGTIVSQQASGIVANGGGTFANVGSISGQVTGITSSFGPAAVTNSGTINGATSPALLFNGSLNNSVTNTGTIGSGGAVAIQFGSGNDTLAMNGGAITKQVEMGDGSDTFTMTAGVMQSIDQGGGLDTATVSGGRIIGAFNDGDFFTMTGGRIGSVNLMVANNVMRMSGGTIDGNVNAEQGNDLLELSGGVIGGNVDFGNGNNIGTITGGQIVGSFITGNGADQFTWSGGNIGGLNLGSNNDVATFRNLTPANLVPGVPIDGGAGFDRLTWDNTTGGDVARFLNWELFELTNASRLFFSSTLTLGDAGTGTGVLSIDPTSAVFAGQGAHAIAPFTAGQLVTVNNAGTIDLTNGPPSATDSLSIAGNYVGLNGRLALQSVLAGDGAPSDRLVISTGNASGATGISVANLGGPGALTTGDGILVVQAINGGTTAGGAFSLAGAVAAGPFEYLLFRGGVTAGAEQNWYLRSSVPASPASSPSPFPPDTPVVPTPEGPVVPLFRVEVPLHSVLPATARQIGLSTLGTFHERFGDQDLLSGNGQLPGVWGRVFGSTHDQSWQGTVRPEFDGSIWGIQVGRDLYGIDRPSGHVDRFGLFYAHARAGGDVRGFAVGELQKSVGSIGLDGDTLGGYWTHVGPSRWYLDAVLMGTFLQSTERSIRSPSTATAGNALTASLEAGYPFALGRGWAIEPQAQMIWQQVSLDPTRDLFSTIAYDDSDAFAGRVGVRLQGSVQAGSTLVEPYFKANLWHTFAGTDRVLFATTPIETARRATAVEIGGGFAAQITAAVAVYGAASYITDVDSDASRQGVGANVSVRVRW